MTPEELAALQKQKALIDIVRKQSRDLNATLPQEQSRMPASISASQDEESAMMNAANMGKTLQNSINNRISEYNLQQVQEDVTPAMDESKAFSRLREVLQRQRRT